MAKTQTNNFDISGKVLEVGGAERISDTFSKRVLILEVFNGKYPNEMPFDFANQNMDQVNDIVPGNWVTINHAYKSFRKERDGVVRRFITLEGISCYKE